MAHKATAEKKTGSAKRTEIGYWASLVYVGLLLSYIIYNWSKLACLPPNELGDFTAGAFGPLAILWLVLGYFQQGDELKQSTDALIQQAAELQQSAAHQAALVEVSRLQVQNEIDRHREERRRQKIKNQPKFSLTWESDDYEYKNRGTLQCTNLGPECMDVHIWCEEDSVNAGVHIETYEAYPILRRNEAVKATLLIPDLNSTEFVEINIWYCDGDDDEQVQTYFGRITLAGHRPRIIFESYAEMAQRTDFHNDLLNEMIASTEADHSQASVSAVGSSE